MPVNAMRHICLGLCAIILATGCTRKEEAITFTVGGAPNELDAWEEIVKEFEQESGGNVDLVRQPTDTDQRRQGLVVALKARQSDPDVFLMDVAWIAQIAASGWLAPLDAYAAEGMLEPGVFFTRVVDLADRYEGQLVALPVNVDGGLLYYRKDLLAEHGFAGPPATWEKLISQSLTVQKARRASDPDFRAFAWQGAQYEGLICTFLEFAASNGGGIILGKDGVTIDTPENIEALQLMYDLIHTHGVSPPNTFTEMKEEEVRTFFQRGHALFERNWPYAWNLHQADDSAVKGSVGIAPLPHFPSGRSASTLGGWHIGISAYSDDKQSSAEFVRFISSRAVQKRFAMELGWNPGRRDVYSDADVTKKYPHFEQLRSVFDNAVPRPNLPYYTQISAVLQQHLNAALSGRTAPGKALAAAEKEARAVAARYEE